MSSARDYLAAVQQRADGPHPGDEVLYRDGATGVWKPAVVLAAAAHDGDLNLDTGDGREMAALDVKHGREPHRWLRYEEAAALTPKGNDS